MSGLFRVQSTDLSVDEALAAVNADDVGGVAVFIGTVRDNNEGRAVTLLEYQAYESMAEKQMAKIALGIAEEVPGVRLAALHRVGALRVGERAVVCVAAAPHRGEAFRACRLLIDRIKADVPVWKREHGPDGPYWVGWQDARCHGHDHGHGHAHTHSGHAEQLHHAGESTSRPPRHG
jgi:molybdopterin synthase catalytic subunit